MFVVDYRFDGPIDLSFIVLDDVAVDIIDGVLHYFVLIISEGTGFFVIGLNFRKRRADDG